MFSKPNFVFWMWRLVTYNYIRKIFLRMSKTPVLESPRSFFTKFGKFFEAIRWAILRLNRTGLTTCNPCIFSGKTWSRKIPKLFNRNHPENSRIWKNGFWKTGSEKTGLKNLKKSDLRKNEQKTGAEKTVESKNRLPISGNTFLMYSNVSNVSKKLVSRVALSQESLRKTFSGLRRKTSY
mgnify:CR=1 FL=1